jgi:hypothetical protein
MDGEEASAFHCTTPLREQTGTIHHLFTCCLDNPGQCIIANSLIVEYQLITIASSVIIIGQ